MLKRWQSRADVFLIVLFALVPLFLNFPYRVNIFLSWEGAFRISEGQIPFRDFGTPLGGMFWVIPAIFFKLFGPGLFTLVKAQVFINIISGLAFRSLLKSFSLDLPLRFIAVFIFCISYSFFNFWPWYNHTVIVYELVGLAFLVRSILSEQQRGYLVVAGAFFMMCSFLTKQDGGAMGILIGGALLVYSAVVSKKLVPLVIYGAALIAFLLLALWIAGPASFGYWFNHGQPPHSARVSPLDLAGELFGGSAWIKFYVFLIILLQITGFPGWKKFFHDKADFLFMLLTLCILGEAAVFQLTSYTPPDNNIFYHSFAAAYLLFKIGRTSPASFRRPAVFAFLFAGTLLWWSGTYWKYMFRIAERIFPPAQSNIDKGGENIVNRYTYMIDPHPLPPSEPESEWKFSALPSFRKIYMPSSTVAGIDRLMKKYPAGSTKNLKVLNMSELTPLAKDMGFALERSPEYPLWFHLGVGMFNKQAIMFEERIARKHYDLVLFEHIPSLNNFYPFRVRDSLKVHYQLVDSFAAPRRGDTPGNIEVYTPR